MALVGVYTPNGYVVGNASAIDARMGPFASADEATGSIIAVKRYKGLTIITTGSNQTNEYWFKDGTANADLVLKTAVSSNTNVITTGSVSTTQSITGSLIISGSTIASGTVYFPNLITSSATVNNVVMFGANGQIFVTASSAIGTTTTISTVGFITTGSSSTNQTITGSLTISGSTVNSGTIFLPNLVTSSTSVTNVVVFGDNGQLFTTASTAVGTAAISTAKFITTGSNNTTQSISGSLNILGNIVAQSASFTYVSFQYVTASSILVDQNTITVRGNHDTNILTAGYIAADSASSPYSSSSFLYNLGPGKTGYWTLDAPLSGSQFTGSLLGSSSYSTTASYAISSSYSLSGSYAVSSSYSLSGSYSTTASYAMSSSYSLSGSYATTSSYAISSSYSLSGSYAVTASYAFNASSVKAGSVANTAFSGNPSSSVVTLNPSYSNASYAVSITGEDARIWTVSSKAKDTFTINSNSTVALTGTTYWITTPYNP